MARLGISTGTTPNDGTGDTLIAGAVKINKNFEEVYTKLGDGTNLLSGNPNLTVGIATATLFKGDGSQLTGVGADVNVQDNGTTVGTVGTINFGDYLDVSPLSSGICTVTSTFVGSNQLGVRTDVSQTTGSLGIGATANIQFAGFKSYVLYKVDTSAPAWVTLYTDSTRRAADATRQSTQDPASGSGVIVETITSGSNAKSQLITPTVSGFNFDNPVSTTIYAKVHNRSGISTNITVTLTILQTET